MTLEIRQSATAVCPRIRASFVGVNGVEPYFYEVLPGGKGGTINSSTGVYTAPQVFTAEDPSKLFDVVRVTDYAGATAESRILVGTPLMLFCEILKREMGLAEGRVYLWNQKLEEPRDHGLYIAVSVPMEKPFGNVNRFNGETNQSEQYLVSRATVDLDVISRGPVARDRKEEIILALNSDYSRFQQDANSFKIGQLDTKFINLAQVDGAAIPYRYRISVWLQYSYRKTKETLYFDSFPETEVVTNN